jgi:release factor glutamine methyltransferase
LILRDVLKASTDYLAGKGVPSPRVDSEHLVAHALGIARLDVYLEHDRPLTEAELASCRELVRRRGMREPLAYVLGEWGFRNLALAVDDRVLVPRAETEIVVDRCLAHLAGRSDPDVLDVGVGSGAIALAIAQEHPGVTVTAIDVSEGALTVALANRERAGLGERVALLLHDLRTGLPGGPYDLVVSNPPYVSPDEIESLEPEVRDWEPREALVDRGETEAVVTGATAVLVPDGWLVLEVGERSADRIAGLLGSAGFHDVDTRLDLADRPRVVEGRWAS